MIFIVFAVCDPTVHWAFHILAVRKNLIPGALSLFSHHQSVWEGRAWRCVLLQGGVERVGSGLDWEVDSYSTTYSYIALTQRVHLSEPQFPHL